MASSGQSSRHKTESLLISRQVFESRMRNVAFESWESLEKAVMDSQPYQGESSTVIKLDPVRIFGWAAAVLINICMWGMVSYLAMWSKWLGLVFVLCYGSLVWWVITRQLSPSLAGILWPVVPMAVAAAGLLFCLILDPEPLEDRGDVCLALAFIVLPQTLLAAYFLRKVSDDPDRATLTVNLFLGAWATLSSAFWLIVGVGPDVAKHGMSSAWHSFFGWSLLILGLGSVILAGRFLLVPGGFASVEMVSWTLNIGAIAIFIAVQVLLEVPATRELWRWLLFAVLLAGLGLLGAVFERSLPILLSAVGCVMLAYFTSVGISDVAKLLGMSPSYITLTGLVTFGIIGISIAVIVQQLGKSQLFADFLAHLRSYHSSAYTQSLVEDVRDTVPVQPQGFPN